MKTSAIKGFCFGLTSGIITTLGMIVGLHSGTNSKMVVIGGILIIALADSFSDSLGIHVSEESDPNYSDKEVWAATISTFVSKLLFSLTFLVPILLFKLDTAIIISIVWGLSILGILSYFLGRSNGTNPYKVVFEHLFVAIIVIIATHFVGDWVAVNFG